jgi:hypothetical protein
MGTAPRAPRDTSRPRAYFANRTAEAWLTEGRFGCSNEPRCSRGKLVHRVDHHHVWMPLANSVCGDAVTERFALCRMAWLALNGSGPRSDGRGLRWSIANHILESEAGVQGIRPGRQREG